MKDSIPKTGDRRLFPRKTLPQVVLVFFTQDRWGRLVNLSEDGMTFEFSSLPETGQTLGVEMVDLEQNSIRAEGRVIWVRQVDKIAGMQFADLSPESKQQITHWLATGTLTHPPTQFEVQLEPHEVKRAGVPPTPSRFPPIPPEPPPQSQAPAPPQAAPLPQAQTPMPAPRTPLTPPASSSAPPLAPSPEPDASPTKERFLAPKAKPPERKPEPVVSRKIDEQPELPPAPMEGAKQVVWDDYFNRAHVGLDKVSVTWKFVVAAIAVIATFALLSVFAGMWAARSRQSRAEAELENSPKPPDAAPSSPQGPDAANTPAGPFEVEVTDAKNKHWSLAFSGGSDTAAVPSAPKSAASTPTAGITEPAQLISSFSPEYPEAAREQNIEGNVVVDLLIDPSGKVLETKPIAGPQLLREPAMATARMWKYSPAKVDGKPVSGHLLVTVRYAKQ
jgi:TonB family protein